MHFKRRLGYETEGGWLHAHVASIVSRIGVFTNEINKEAIGRNAIPRTLFCLWMKNEGFQAYKPTLINELKDRNVEV